MDRRRQRVRRNSVTRTYPVYAISTSDLSDENDSIVEIQPVRRLRRRPKDNATIWIKQPVSDVQTVERTRVVPERSQKSATMQTDETLVDPPPDNPSDAKTPTKTRRCPRIFAFILATLMLIISILLLIFSLNLLLNPNMTKIRSVAIIYPHALPQSTFSGTGPTDTLLVASIIGLIIGCIGLVSSIIAILILICLKSRHHCLFYTAPVLLMVLILILIGLALFVLITGELQLQRLASSTVATVLYAYNSTSTTLVRDGWDFVQYYFGCCGVTQNNIDWLYPPTNGWKYVSTLPLSCCGQDPNDAGHGGRIFLGNSVPSLTGVCYYGDIGQPVCYDNIKTNLLITVLVFLIGFALIILALFILLIILLLMQSKRYHRVQVHQNEK